MIFNGQTAPCKSGAALVEGTFGGTAVKGLIVDKGLGFIPDNRVSAPSQDLDQRLGDSWEESVPTVLLTGNKGDLSFIDDLSYGSPLTRDHDDGLSWTLCSPVTKDQKTKLSEALALPEYRIAGGDPNNAFFLILDEIPAGQRYPVRILHDLPGTHVSGLNPFFTAIGAEPVAVMPTGTIDPLLDKLSAKGPGTVAVLSRAGAFLWTMDLKGRKGLEAVSCVRVDEDVILPLTAGLEPGAHVVLTTYMDSLLRRAGYGRLDVCFITNPPDAAEHEALKSAAELPAHFLQFPNPFGLKSAK